MRRLAHHDLRDDVPDLLYLALLTTIFEYKHIHCAQKWRLVTNLFTFPIFMFSYIPITVAALFLKVDWVPTQHAVNVTLDEVMQGAK